MAGRPRMRQLIADIEAKDEGVEWVFDQLADGRTVRSVAEELGVSRRYLYMWRDRPEAKHELKPMWEAAVRMSAEADLEASTHDFERLDRVIGEEDDGSEKRRVPQSAEVQLATGRAKFRQWNAARKDPDKYGDKSGVEINLNIGDLHLEAMANAKARHALQPPVLEAQVLDEDEDEDDDDLSALM